MTRAWCCFGCLKKNERKKVVHHWCTGKCLSLCPTCFILTPNQPKREGPANRAWPAWSIWVTSSLGWYYILMCVCVSLWWALEWAGKPVFCYCLHHHSQPKRPDLITDTEWASFPTGWRLNTDYSSQVSRFIRGLWSVYHNMQTAAIKSTDLGEFFNLLLPNLKFNPLQFQNYWYPLTE